MKKTNKRVFIVVLTLILIFASACSKALAVRIPEDIFTYQLNVVMDENPGIKEEEAIKKAENLSIVYYKVNRKFKESKATLKNNEKKEISDKTNNYWDLFYKFYESIGIEKKTLTNASQAAVFRRVLIQNEYEKKGGLTDEVLQKYFNDNFVCFKSVSFPITTVNNFGQKVKLSDEEIKKLVDTLNKMKASVTEDKSFEEVVAEHYKNTGEISPDAIDLKVTNKIDKRYSKENLDKIVKAKVDAIEIIKDEEGYYLIQKVDNAKEFANNKNLAIEAKTKQDAESMTASWYKDEKFTFNKAKEKRIYNKIKTQKEKFNENG
ncbi:MAG: hypothetical protein Q4E28_01125 [Clostridia bacterium]|nr:hypothetical protein [Clostridia bacterium]